MRDSSFSKILFIVVGALILAGAAYYVFSSSQRQDAQSRGGTVTNWQGNNFTAIEITGEQFSLSYLSDRPVVVHFWASWCGPCVNEFPQMIRFIESLNGKVHLVALSADKSDEDIKSFIKKVGARRVPFVHVIRDEGSKIAEQYRAKMLPTSVILGKGLKVEKRIPGEVDWEDPKLRGIFNSLISSSN